jgi:YVTN family beta-propeller protein
MDNRQWREFMDAAMGVPPGRVTVAAVRRRVIRRRVMESVAGAAAVAVIAAAVPVGIGALGRGPAAGPMAVPTVYVLSDYGRSGVIQGALTPISTATNIPGRPIPLGPDLAQPQVMAMTPDGKTIYVAEGLNTVTPVSTVTNTAGKPIPVGLQPTQILFTPDGKTAYVLTASQTPTLTPIATATNTPGKTIKVERPGPGGPQMMAITPNGKTLYVIAYPHPTNTANGPAYMIPISTATNTPGKPIRIGMYTPMSLVMSPDGKTAYFVGMTLESPLTDVIPIATATNTLGRTSGGDQVYLALAITPDGKTLYLSTDNSYGVIPFATATNTLGKLIKIPGAGNGNMVIAPDGSTAYISSPGPTRGPFGTCTGPGQVTPISTATNVPGPPIRVGCRDDSLAITHDGKTVWVGGGDTVTPISTATNTPGPPIKIIGGPVGPGKIGKAIMTIISSITAIAVTP